MYFVEHFSLASLRLLQMLFSFKVYWLVLYKIFGNYNFRTNWFWVICKQIKRKSIIL